MRWMASDAGVREGKARIIKRFLWWPRKERRRYWPPRYGRRPPRRHVMQWRWLETAYLLQSVAHGDHSSLWVTRGWETKRAYDRAEALGAGTWDSKRRILV